MSRAGGAGAPPSLPRFADRNSPRSFGPIPSCQAATVGAVLPVLPISGVSGNAAKAEDGR